MSQANEPKLEPKQAEFCLQYCIDYNATLAAKRAGYSASTARQIGSENLSKPAIRAEIQRLQEAHANEVKISLERLDAELVRIATFDPRNLVDEDGRSIPLQELDESVSSAIAGFEFVDYFEEKVQQGVLRKFKLHDKRQAIELLFKRRGALVDKVEHSFDLSKNTDEELEQLERILGKAAADS
jgi:phage terminase small subunit